jgi:hypothetical protein
MAIWSLGGSLSAIRLLVGPWQEQGPWNREAGAQMALSRTGKQMEQTREKEKPQQLPVL